MSFGGFSSRGDTDRYTVRCHGSGGFTSSNDPAASHDKGSRILFYPMTRQPLFGQAELVGDS